MSSGAERPAEVDLLVLGASFAGVELIWRLRRSRVTRDWTIAVVDRQRSHGYIPLQHERLVGRLPWAATALPTARYIARPPHHTFVHGEVVDFDPATHTATLEGGRTLRGRHVVIALGSSVAPPPAIPGHARLHTYKFDGEVEQLGDALAATLAGRPQPADAPAAARPRVLVVGGGITGVEIAGELAHLARARPPGWVAPEVTLVSGGARLLDHLHPRAGRAAARALEGQGVDLRLHTRLVALHEHGATLHEGPEVAGGGGPLELPCELAIWAGGVRPAAVLQRLRVATTQAGWIAVSPTLQCAIAAPAPPAPMAVGHLFAIGDAVRVVGDRGEWPTMQRAIECIFQAGTVAAHLRTIARAEARTQPDGRTLPRPPVRPPLRPHALWRDFPHGVSLGGRSLVVFGPLVLDWPHLNTWFRRFLMHRYFARYPALGPGAEGSSERSADAAADHRRDRDSAR